jgi:UDP-glucose 4-epimerase
MKKSTILVTGGAGYIGSHVVMALQQIGYAVLVLDNLEFGHRTFVEDILQVDFICGDINDHQLLTEIFSTYSIEAVMHFAAYTYVGESVTNPLKYYQNNVVGTIILLQAMLQAGVNKIVFSSTAAIYGNPLQIPITEEHPQQPISPYGWTKLLGEKILVDCHQAYQLNSICFRYFNAAGADKQGRLGEERTPETHLIPLALRTALGQREKLIIYGNDYETPDGTGIRDYIHVIDLAQAHILGLQYLLNGGSSDVFNLGNGHGFSVREVIDAIQTMTGKSFPIVEEARRPGDPPILVSSSQKAREILGWQPVHTRLEEILEDSWRWYRNNSIDPR